jgi:hypothetical protein
MFFFNGTSWVSYSMDHYKIIGSVSELIELSYACFKIDVASLFLE